MYEYVTANDPQLEMFIETQIVQVFLCTVHLSKNFLRDVKETIQDAKERKVAEIFFVSMVHSTELTHLRTLFDAMCKYFLSNNEQQRDKIIGELSAEALLIDEIIEANDEDTHNTQKWKEEPIYKNSPFYVLFHTIFEDNLKSFNIRCSTSQTKFIEMPLRKYLAYVPWWTGICHYPKSRAGNFLPKFRTNTAMTECLWGRWKEELRASIGEIGKMPVPPDRLINFLKTETRANIIHHRLCIPKKRINARKGQYKRESQMKQKSIVNLLNPA